MTYWESAKGKKITYERALEELRKHCCDDEHTVAEFDKVWEKNQKNKQIKATVVLEFLGH